MSQWHYAIYQIDMDKDKRRVAYMCLEKTEKLGGVDAAIYRNVWNGNMGSNAGAQTVLEELYSRFQFRDGNEPPRGYRGHSMSVSDVVVLWRDSQHRASIWFCDSIGFKLVDLIDKAQAGKWGTA